MASERSAGLGRKGSMQMALTLATAETATQAQSWRAFYDENWQWIFRLVRRLGWGDIDVEDAVQDVFLVLLDKLAGFEGRSELKTWVHRVCINVVSEHRRRARRRQLLSAVTFWRAGPKTPHEQVETRHEVEALRRALQQLAPKKR